MVLADGNALLAEIDALLVAWRPGTQGGPAIANLLFGDANPSGRLAQSWLRSAGQAGSGKPCHGVMVAAKVSGVQDG